MTYTTAGILWPHALAFWETHKSWTDQNTEPTVAQVLYSLAVANKAKLIVELGVRNSTTAYWLIGAAAHTGGRYVGIDSAPVLEHIEGGEFLQDTLPDCLPRHFQPGTIDLAFVDDNHAPEHVHTEIETLWPLMAPGGLITFHDVIGAFGIWDMLTTHYHPLKLVYQQFKEDHAVGGLGVIQVL